MAKCNCGCGKEVPAGARFQYVLGHRKLGPLSYGTPKNPAKGEKTVQNSDQHDNVSDSFHPATTKSIADVNRANQQHYGPKVAVAKDAGHEYTVRLRDPNTRKMSTHTATHASPGAHKEVGEALAKKTGHQFVSSWRSEGGKGLGGQRQYKNTQKDEADSGGPRQDYELSSHAGMAQPDGPKDAGLQVPQPIHAAAVRKAYKKAKQTMPKGMADVGPDLAMSSRSPAFAKFEKGYHQKQAAGFPGGRDASAGDKGPVEREHVIETLENAGGGQAGANAIAKKYKLHAGTVHKHLTAGRIDHVVGAAQGLHPLKGSPKDAVHLPRRASRKWRKGTWGGSSDAGQFTTTRGGISENAGTFTTTRGAVSGPKADLSKVKIQKSPPTTGQLTKALRTGKVGQTLRKKLNFGKQYDEQDALPRGHKAAAELVSELGTRALFRQVAAGGLRQDPSKTTLTAAHYAKQFSTAHHLGEAMRKASGHTVPERRKGPGTGGYHTSPEAKS